MAMKEFLHRLQPVQIHIVLALSVAYFVVQLFLSHITHALTLLVASYHMLCNIVALTGSIITIKHCSNNNADNSQSSLNRLSDESKFIEINEHVAQRHERSLRNTFGWTRIDILTMLIGGIFLAAFCFSLLIEAVQTLIHIDHQDTMHHPVAVALLGLSGLLLNGLCFWLIGGYTYHQGSFLCITDDGDVILNRVVTSEGLRRGSRRLSKTKRDKITATPPPSPPVLDTTSSTQAARRSRTQTCSEILRDISSTVFVIICSIVIYFGDNENVTKFVDPIISIVSCIILLVFSYPYMKESCLILLQTIPGSIDIELFKADLLKSFSDIVSVHDLHIWQLTSSKYVSTVHILFQNPNVYVQIKDDVIKFFHDQGITIVTIQPEFNVKSIDGKSSTSTLSECLIGCQSIECAPKTCCSVNSLSGIVTESPPKRTKYQKSKNSKKSSSLLSLNVMSLAKMKKMNGSKSEILKKSVSESHVGQIQSESDRSLAHSSDASNLPSSNDLNVIQNSIKEFKEDETSVDVNIDRTSDKLDKQQVVDVEEQGLLDARAKSVTENAMNMTHSQDNVVLIESKKQPPT